MNRPKHVKNQFKKFKEEIKKYKPRESLLDYANAWDAAFNAKKAEYNSKNGINPDRSNHKIFFNPYDHLEHSPETIKNDMEDVKVQQTEKIPEKGRYCQPFDFVTAHWIATQKDGTVVEDSRKFAKGQPKNFQLGKY